MQDRPSDGSQPPCIERPRLVKCLNVLVNSHKLSSNRLILSFNFPYQSMVTSIRFRLGTSNRFESAPIPSFKLSNVLFWHDLCTCHLVKAAIKISLFEGSFVESHPGNKAFHNATRCDTLQHTARLQHAASHCNTLQHTATHCNTLQHTATYCNTLQHTATHCNTLQRSAICTITCGNHQDTVFYASPPPCSSCDTNRHPEESLLLQRTARHNNL